MTGPAVLIPTVQVLKKKVWKNWHESVKATVARLVNVWNAQPTHPSIPSYNATTAALQKLIAEAQADNLELRAAGGTWSLTPVAATTGVLVNTQPLNYRFWLGDADLDASRQGSGANLVFAQCGMSIAELNTALHARGKSLRTSGASNGQTIAGAIGTGTHGSAIGQGAIQDSVVALHLITAADRHIWLERASSPVASPQFVASLGAEFVANDEWFNAALVGLGSFGLVHGVVLEAVDLFWLQSYRKQYDDVPGTRAATERLDFATLAPRPGVNPYFFQSLFNPYDPSRKPHLTIMYDSPQDPGGPQPQHHDKWRVGDSAAELVANLTDLAGGTPPFLANLLVTQMNPDVDGESGRWADMFWDTSTRGKSAGMAIGVPIARLREAIDALYDVNTTIKAPGIFAVRYVRPSRATLAFTRHSPMTCVIDLDGVQSVRMNALQDAAWRRLVQLGIPITFHWGKLHPADPALVRTMYGGAVDAWRAARQALLPQASLRKVFSNQYLRDIQLDT